MRLPYAAAFRALIRPLAAFEAAPPPLGLALRTMLLAWTPLALANATGTLWQGLRAYQTLRLASPPPWVAGWLDADPTALQALLRDLPAAPSFARIWPWLLVVAPLGILGTWLHHAVWDHTGLWLLGGLKGRRGFRTSLGAEAEALRFAAAGTLLHLLGFIPGLGSVLALPLLMLDGYLWLFRGFALAARHGCEPWRGMAATVVHAVLLGGCTLGLCFLMLALVRMGA